MSTLGFIGSGNVGTALARLAVAAGIDVVMSNSRGPETLADLVAELGPQARAGTPSTAAQDGDWVVITIPLAAYSALPAESLAGKVVIDTTNYYPWRDGNLAPLDSGEITSSEVVQQHLSGARLVKAFNSIDVQHLPALARHAGATPRTAIPIAGDDPDAKQTAADLIDRLGFDTVDAGTLAEGWRFEPETLPYVMPYYVRPDALTTFLRQLGDSLRSGRPLTAAPPEDAGKPLPADKLRALLDESSRKLAPERVLI